MDTQPNIQLILEFLKVYKTTPERFEELMDLPKGFIANLIESGNDLSKEIIKKINEKYSKQLAAAEIITADFFGFGDRVQFTRMPGFGYNNPHTYDSDKWTNEEIDIYQERKRIIEEGLE